MKTVRLGTIEDFPINTCRVVTLSDGAHLTVINLEGEFHAFEGRCGPGGHHVQPVAVIADEGKVLCPWHGWELDLKTGICSANPDCVMKVYPVRLDGDTVMVESV